MKKTILHSLFWWTLGAAVTIPLFIGIKIFVWLTSTCVEWFHLHKGMMAK